MYRVYTDNFPVVHLSLSCVCTCSCTPLTDPHVTYIDGILKLGYLKAVGIPAINGALCGLVRH